MGYFMEKINSFAKILFTFLLVLCVNSVFAAWDGTEKVEPTKEGDYYIIKSEANLAWYAKNYNMGNARLDADLDLGGKPWTPIAAGKGDNNNKYSKTFDGNGHIIKNLYINADSLHGINKDYTQNLGFIGVLGGGKVRNLVLENVNIQASTNAGSVLSNKNQQISVGGVVGWMNELNSNLVENCMVSGIISTTGSGQGVGGIVGNAKQGTITNCLSLVEIRTSGSNAYVGGIIGITKDAVTVSSCVYAGPGLLNIGINNGGSVGGIAGNVFSGTLTLQEDYYEGEDNLQVFGSKCFGNFDENGECKSSPSVDVKGNVKQVDISNQDSVACHLNGMNTDNTCKTEPWSVGETFLSLSGYGTDGYMIVFYANGGTYADGSVAKNKFFDAGMVINADDIVPPSDEENTFIGWALSSNATEPENLGTVFERDTVFAVWQPKLTVTFDVSPGAFPDDSAQVKTKMVDKGGLVTVGGLGTLPTSYCVDSSGVCSGLRYFTGWTMNESREEKDTIHLDTFTTDKNLTLYAVWTKDTTYTVTYNANGHGKTRVDYVRVKNGNTIEVPQSPNAHEGYVFDGWFTNASCEEGAKFDFKTPITKSIVLYAKWKPQSYTITYVIGEDGAANSPENPSEYNIESETINLKAPTPVDGKVFEGWFNDDAFSKKVTRIAKGSFGVKIFYAKYSTKTYRISYLADNNSYGSVSDQFKEHGSSITLLSSGNFSRAKETDTYEQIGWTDSPNGVIKYELGATYETDTSLILYPVWSHKRYTIIYKCDDCVNNAANPSTYTIDDEFVFENPEKDGYTFKGWYNKKNNLVTGIVKNSKGDVELTAKWEGPIEYEIVYKTEGLIVDENGNSIDSLLSQPQIYTVHSNDIVLPKSVRDGYTFIGWYDEDDNLVEQIAHGSTGDVELTAKWEIIVYTVTYVTKNGASSQSNVTSYTVDDVADDKVIELKPAVRCGFKFEGWFKDENFSGDAVTQINNGDDNLTLYPKWGENTNLVADYGAVKIYEDEDGTKCAAMDGRSFGSVAINDDVNVGYVTLDREFTENIAEDEYKLSTIVLPFTIEKNKINGASFYKMVSVVPEGSNRGVYISPVKDDVIIANTPYIIRPTKKNLTFITDKENGETLTLNTSVMNNTKSKSGKWELRGLYSYKKWLDGDEELGYAYGYTAKSTNKLAAGKFDINEVNAYTFPFRAYLLNIPQPKAVAPSPFLAKSASTGSASVEELVQSGAMEVFVVDGFTGENGGTTTIATLRKTPSSVKTVNGWYDMKGRRLNGKPTAKGIYYFNNKRVRIQ